MPKIKDPASSCFVVADLRIENGYLYIKPSTKNRVDCLIKENNLLPVDTNLIFWEQEREIYDVLNLSLKEIESLHKGMALKKYVKETFLKEESRKKRKRRERRKHVLQEIELVSKSLHKLFLKDKRLCKKANKYTESGILQFMDGSTLQIGRASCREGG